MLPERKIDIPENKSQVMPDALARVVDEIRSDARIEPGRYLEDTVVPEGGE